MTLRPRRPPPDRSPVPIRPRRCAYPSRAAVAARPSGPERRHGAEWELSRERARCGRPPPPPAAIRAARVSGRRASATQPSIILRADGGNAAKLTAAGGRASSAAVRSCGTSSRSAESRISHHPFAFARSMAARPGRSHPPLIDQPLDARLVGGSPDAARLAPREVELAPLVVHVAARAIDPAEAQRFLHRRLVVETDPAGPWPPGHQPGAASRRVVRLKPGAPRGAIVRVDKRRVIECGHDRSLGARHASSSRVGLRAAPRTRRRRRPGSRRRSSAARPRASSTRRRGR